jgi:hypothetical protein
MVSATSWSLVQRSPTECGVSKSVIVKPRKIRRPRPPRGFRVIKKNRCLYLQVYGIGIYIDFINCASKSLSVKFFSFKLFI